MNLMTPEEVVRRLGLDKPDHDGHGLERGLRRLRAWRMEERLPFIKFGDANQDEVRYDPKDVEAFIEARRRKHTSDPGPDVKKQRRRRKPSEAKAAA